MDILLVETRFEGSRQYFDLESLLNSVECSVARSLKIPDYHRKSLSICENDNGGGHVEGMGSSTRQDTDVEEVAVVKTVKRE